MGDHPGQAAWIATPVLMFPPHKETREGPKTNRAGQYVPVDSDTPIFCLDIGEGFTLTNNAEAFKEVQRLFFESRKYYISNGDKLVKEIAARQKQDYSYLKWWLENGGVYPLSLEDEWVNALDRFYQLAYEIGDLSSRPNTRELIWKGYWEKASK